MSFPKPITIKKNIDHLDLIVVPLDRKQKDGANIKVCTIFYLSKTFIIREPSKRTERLTPQSFFLMLPTLLAALHIISCFEEPLHSIDFQELPH